MDWAIVAGAVVQFVGLVLLLVDIAEGRAREFGVTPPWAIAAARLRRVARWLTRREGRVYTDSMTGRMEAHGTLTARGTVRPGLDPERHVSERLAALERYVSNLDDDLRWLSGRVGEVQREAIARTDDAEERIRADIHAREAARKAALKRSQARQAASAGLIALGLALGTAGALV